MAKPLSIRVTLQDGSHIDLINISGYRHIDSRETASWITEHRNQSGMRTHFTHDKNPEPNPLPISGDTEDDQ